MGLGLVSHTQVKSTHLGPLGKNGTRWPARTVGRLLIPIPYSQEMQSKPFLGDWVVLVRCKKGGFGDG